MCCIIMNAEGMSTYILYITYIAYKVYILYKVYKVYKVYKLPYKDAEGLGLLGFSFIWDYFS